MIISKKYILTLVFIAAIAIVSLIIWTKVWISHIQVTIVGEHNPITTEVKIDGKNISPSGDGGKLYYIQKRPETYQLTISGPFIKEIIRDVQMGLRQKQSLPVTVSVRSKEEVAEEVLGKTMTISNVTVFETNWIVATQETATDKVLHVLWFNSGKGGWGEVIGGDKIDSQDSRLHKAPPALKEFLLTEGGY